MAVAIHIAHIAFLPINKRTGKVVDKNNSTINETLATEHRHVILPDTIKSPNSIDHPSVDEYLILEAAGGFVLKYMDQNTIVTYPV